MDKLIEGTLQPQQSGRWAVVTAEEEAIEITSGDQFFIEVPGAGAMVLTRMEYGRVHGRGQYYSVDGHQLRPGLRAQYVGERFFR